MILEGSASTEPSRSIPRSVADVIGRHVTLEVEGIDRMYLNVCLHGLIERLPKSHRYRVTKQGWRAILFCTRCCHQLLRPGLAQLVPEEAAPQTDLRRRFDQIDQAIEDLLVKENCAG